MNPMPDAQHIATGISQLAERLSGATPDTTAQLLIHILDGEDSILSRFTHLFVTASRYAKDHAPTTGPNENVWRDLALATAHAANALHDMELDLDQWAADLHRLADPAGRRTPGPHPHGDAASLPL